MPEYTKRFNPFNSNKLFAQVPRWTHIKYREHLPPPTTISIDPANVCNLKCRWCNADKILTTNSGMLSESLIYDLARAIGAWQCDGFNVESICIGGGGEPTCNPNFEKLVVAFVENQIRVGVVTNGTLIDKHLFALPICDWVGVSMDAGCAVTFAELKGVDKFEKIVANIELLTDYAAAHWTTLDHLALGNGVSYKFLAHPRNVHEISWAASIAKETGCKSLHIRPVGSTWWHDTSYDMTEVVRVFNEQVELARNLEDEQFGVYGITHKFGGNFEVVHNFHKCRGALMTCVIMPSSDGNNNHFNLGLCCDRRGDPNLLLGENLTSAYQILELWGSKKHWDLVDAVNINTCSRCTYDPHSQIYENAVLIDNMTIDFI